MPESTISTIESNQLTLETVRETKWNIGGNDLTEEQLVTILLAGNNPRIAAAFFYRICAPLFNSIYNKYYTDCENVVEFINEIYAYILYEKMDERTPDRRNCKLAKFGFRCTLTMWLKIVATNYCHQLFEKKAPAMEDFSDLGDRLEVDDSSLMENVKSTAKTDVIAILNSMPNERYSTLIRYRYIEQKTNEETAELMSMTMANYYNNHKRAKAQFCEALRKEGLI